MDIFKKISDLFRWFGKLSLKARAALLVLLLVVIWVSYLRIHASSAKPRYQTADVVRESIISTITESGNVSSMSQTNIGSPTNGVIQEVYVKNGDKVTAGQNLFKVKSTATPQEQASAYASLLSSQNNLNSAQEKMNSLQSSLFKANQAFINDRGIQNPTDQQKQDPKYIEENADWLQAESDYNNQAGVIAAARASYNNAALTYAATQDSVVTAPIDGTVANFSSEVGNNVTASGTTYNNTSAGSSSSGSTSTPVLVLGDFSNLSIKTSVSEIDVSKIRPGLKATITLDALPDQTFAGKVQSVDTIGTNSSGVVTFNAYISFTAPSAKITPGMSATAVIQTARHDDVLGIPTSAVQTGANGNYVRVFRNGSIVQIPVETGLASDTDTEITSGLAEGQSVVTTIVTPTAVTGQTASPFGAFGGNRGFGGVGRGGGR